ncbi:MAG TPA: amidohydrolase family protein [Gammaproteobacteria bacterium]|nr:amidohydrolase family protein [Gammaproteobacteria bacterium]
MAENDIRPLEGITRIATEEAFAPPDMIERYKRLIRDRQTGDPGFESLMGYFLFSGAPHTEAVVARLQDLGDRRLADMAAAGIGRQIIALTAPGLQIFDADTAVGLAPEYNDMLAQAVSSHPEKFSGLAAVAPQDPAAAAQELERSVNVLGLRGVVVNSHTHGEYMDDQKFWPIFEAAEALDVPVYLHPQTPPPAMIQPLLECGLDGAIYGFGVETGMHLLRIILSGVFDRFPKLRLVVGHLGEGIPYWLFRVDFFYRSIVRTKRYERIRELEHSPSDYMRRNVWLTTSGMAWEPVIMYARDVIGAGRVLYAMDYPYQYRLDEVPVTDRLPIERAALKRFYQTTAEELFRL